MKAAAFLVTVLLTPSAVHFPSPLAAAESVMITYPTGYTLTANHLINGDCGLNVVFLNVPQESLILRFANNNYFVDVFDGTSWLDDATGAPSLTAVPPGEGFFFFNPGSEDLHVEFRGEILRGTVSHCFPPGFKFAGFPVPEPFSPNLTPTFPRIPELQIARYIPAGQPGGPGYRPIICDGFIFVDYATGLPSNEIIPVGEGFLVFNPQVQTICWVADFGVE